jgi:hypothetical protein
MSESFDGAQESNEKEALFGQRDDHTAQPSLRRGESRFHHETARLNKPLPIQSSSQGYGAAALR